MRGAPGAATKRGVSAVPALVAGPRCDVQRRSADRDQGAEIRASACRMYGCSGAPGKHRIPVSGAAPGPDEVNGDALSAERAVVGGQQLDVEVRAEPFASLLVRLVRESPAIADVRSLSPSPPWTAWDHPGPHVWPVIDEVGRLERHRCRWAATSAPDTTRVKKAPPALRVYGSAGIWVQRTCCAAGARTGEGTPLCGPAAMRVPAG